MLRLYGYVVKYEFLVNMHKSNLFTWKLHAQRSMYRYIKYKLTKNTYLRNIRSSIQHKVLPYMSLSNCEIYVSQFQPTKSSQFYSASSNLLWVPTLYLVSLSWIRIARNGQKYYLKPFHLTNSQQDLVELGKVKLIICSTRNVTFNVKKKILVF